MQAQTLQALPAFDRRVTLQIMRKSSTSKDRKVNKAEWIRSQPATTPAKDVVTKAKAEGITLTVAQVYTTRSMANRKPKGPGSRRGNAGRSTGDTEAAFRRFVLTLGLDRVESMLAQIKRTAGF